MNKTLKTILIIIILIIVISTLGTLGYAFLKGERKGAENTNTVTNVSSVNTNQKTNSATANSNSTSANNNVNSGNINTAIPTGSTNLEDSLKTTASNFAELFGSYSNQSNFENISRTLFYMSEKMQAWANQYVAEQQALQSENDPYYGISTKTLSTTTVALNEETGKAEFTVTTQRNETGASVNTANVFYQDLSIKFIKENGSWKVDEARWQ